MQQKHIFYRIDNAQYCCKCVVGGRRFFCEFRFIHIFFVWCVSLSRIMIRLLACFFKGMEQIHIQIIFGAMHFVFLSLFFLLSCLTVIHYFCMLLIYEFDLIIFFLFICYVKKREVRENSYNFENLLIFFSFSFNDTSRHV